MSNSVALPSACLNEVANEGKWSVSWRGVGRRGSFVDQRTSFVSQRERFQYTITDVDGHDSVTQLAQFNSLAFTSTAPNAATDIIYVFSDIGANARLNGNVAGKQPTAFSDKAWRSL